jgi:hypothetical protein
LHHHKFNAANQESSSHLWRHELRNTDAAALIDAAQFRRDDIPDRAARADDA